MSSEREHMTGMHIPAPELPRDRLWDVHDVAAYLKRSASWVYKRAAAGELQRAKGLGWGLRFEPAEVEAFARGERRGASVVPIKRSSGG